MQPDFIVLYITTFVLGAVLGSFACCQAWRLRAHSKGQKLGSRSICMTCNAKLKWYDNLPIISWLMLRGKCRNCKTKIGLAEILSEIGLGLTFLTIAIKYFSGLETVSSFFTSPFEVIIQPLILVIALTIYWVILVYDAKWSELPVILMLIEIPLAVLFQIACDGDFIKTAAGAALLSGIYYLLYFFSKEKLVGGGDWILCISIAVFLGHWEFAIIELFLSNLIATIAGIPQILKKDKKPIPFGPFLIISLVLILFASNYISKFFIL